MGIFMKKITQLINETHPHLSKLMMGKECIGKIKNALEKIELFAQNPNDYRVIKFSQGILYLSVSTAAFATQLRHTSSLLLSILQRQLPEISFNAIQCKVSTTISTSSNETVYQKNKLKVISAKIKMKLSQLSEKVDSKELGKALKKLVR